MFLGGEGTEVRPDSFNVLDTVARDGKASGADFLGQEGSLFWSKRTPNASSFRFQFYKNCEPFIGVTDNIRDAGAGGSSRITFAGDGVNGFGLDNINVPLLAITPKENFLLDLFFRLLIFALWSLWRILLLGVVAFNRFFNALLIIHIKNGRRI